MKVSPDKAYCMNLDKRTDRWEQVQKDFARLQAVMDIELERVSACENVKNPRSGVETTFKSIVQKAIDSELPYVLILEDDVYPIDPDRMVVALENAPDDWDLLLGGVYYYRRRNGEKYNEYWQQLGDFCSLHFIIIRDRVYTKIMNLQCRGRHLDRSLGTLSARGVLKTYVMHPMPCQQRPGYSNLRRKAVDDNKIKNLPWIDHPDRLP